MISSILRLPQGFCLEILNIPDKIRHLVLFEDWPELDKEFQRLTSKGGLIHNTLLKYIYFKDIEFMISIRDSANPWEEDGIWHDDGSRILAFSLSLTLDHQNIEGGTLGIRRKGEEEFIEIPTPPFGTMIIFLTGVHGHEHKIHQVTKGRRLVIAGWCT